MHFHNEMMDLLAAVGVPTDDLFDAAQAHVRFYYHKVIVDDFLSQIDRSSPGNTHSDAWAALLRSVG